MNQDLVDLFRKKEADELFRVRWEIIANSHQFTDDEEEYHMKGLAELWFFWGWSTAIDKGATLNIQEQ